MALFVEIPKSEEAPGDLWTRETKLGHVMVNMSLLQGTQGKSEAQPQENLPFDHINRAR